MISQDVIHSFWLPDFRIKMDLYPNRYTGYSFRTPKLEPGEEYQDHWLFCAEYCGDFHSEMAGVLRVMPYGRYDAGHRDRVGPGRPEPGRARAADLLVQVRHLPLRRRLGDDRADLAEPLRHPVQFADGSTVRAADDNYIRESIIYPGAKIHAGYPAVMPAFETLPKIRSWA